MLPKPSADAWGPSAIPLKRRADFAARMAAHTEVAVCYPVYCSGVPRPMREFAIRYQGAFQGKQVLIFCTQMLYSGDGARAFTDLFPPGWFTVRYAEHFFMPGNLCNVMPAWTFGEKFARRCAEKAEEKIERICRNLERGRRVRRGFGRPSRLLGALQRQYLPATEDKARDAVTIGEGCTGCGLCASRCPAGNLLLVRGKPVPQAAACFATAASTSVPVRPSPSATASRSRSSITGSRPANKTARWRAAFVGRRSGGPLLLPLVPV